MSIQHFKDYIYTTKWYKKYVFPIMAEYRAIPYKKAQKLAVENGKEPKTILFYPLKPHYIYVIYKFLSILGYNITSDTTSKADLIVNFEDITIRKEDRILKNLKKKHKILNIDCKDISKEHVEEIFEKVFGYGLIVDPLKFKGEVVRKSSHNAAHDGKILMCPTSPKKGYVYQQIIDNKYGAYVRDMRTPIVGNKIPFVYYKYRNLSDRFSNTNIKAKMMRTEKIYTKGELKKIIEFSKLISLDYGELDILRDKKTKKIYIIDVNNTPAGPPNHISKEEYKLALKKLGETFENEFLLA